MLLVIGLVILLFIGTMSLGVLLDGVLDADDQKDHAFAVVLIGAMLFFVLVLGSAYKIAHPLISENFERIPKTVQLQDIIISPDQGKVQTIKDAGLQAESPI